jgi:hypothetical protein
MNSEQPFELHVELKLKLKLKHVYWRVTCCWRRCRSCWCVQTAAVESSQKNGRVLRQEEQGRLRRRHGGGLKMMWQIRWMGSTMMMGLDGTLRGTPSQCCYWLQWLAR